MGSGHSSLSLSLCLTLLKVDLFCWCATVAGRQVADSPVEAVLWARGYVAGSTGEKFGCIYIYRIGFWDERVSSSNQYRKQKRVNQKTFDRDDPFVSVLFMGVSFETRSLGLAVHPRHYPKWGHTSPISADGRHGDIKIYIYINICVFS